MEATITLGQLAQIVVFLLIVAVGVYAIFILRRINILTGHLRALIGDNREPLTKSITHLEQVMENSAAVSRQLHESFNEATKTIKAIGSDTAETVLTINKTADYVSTYAVVIHEILKSLVKLFTAQEKK